MLQIINIIRRIISDNNLLFGVLQNVENVAI